VIELLPAAGTVEKLYLDAQTYLPVRANTEQTVAGNFGSIEVYFDDWREVDGIKFPFSLTISVSSPKTTLSISFKEIRNNVALDASIFEP